MASYPIYQFYAELREYKPKMWRRFQVLNNISIAKFAYILMTMFEMKASHLFCFNVPYLENLKRAWSIEFAHRGLDYVIDDEFSYLNKFNRNWRVEIIDDYSYDYLDEENERLVDAVKTKLKEATSHLDDKMEFKYDFGDGWIVDITLEKIIVDKEFPGSELPRVIEGNGYGIIENCGGVPGLENIAKVFKKKSGNEYEEYCQWLGTNALELGSFDVEDINFRLKRVPRIYKDIYEYDLEPTKHSINILERKYKKN